MTDKRIVYFDMDGVLVDFESGIKRLTDAEREAFEGRFEDCPNIFERMDPMPGAIEAVHKLAKVYDVYVLSTAPWANPTALQNKLWWIKEHFGADENSPFYKRVVLTHRKDLNKKQNSILIDDRLKHGADLFDDPENGNEHIHFGESGKYKNWDEVLGHLLNEEQ